MVGGLGLLAAARRWGRVYCAGAGVVFLLLGALGFVAPGLVAGLLAHANAPVLTDNLLHFMSGIGFAYFGFMPGARTPGRAQPARAR